MSEFTFPKNNEAARISLYEQALKVHEEADEVLELVIDDPLNDKRILEETYDVINAAEGVLRKYSSAQRKAARIYVEEKCRMRGNYEEVS